MEIKRKNVQGPLYIVLRLLSSSFWLVTVPTVNWCKYLRWTRTYIYLVMKTRDTMAMGNLCSCIGWMCFRSTDIQRPRFRTRRDSWRPGENCGVVSGGEWTNAEKGCRICTTNHFDDCHSNCTVSSIGPRTPGTLHPGTNRYSESNAGKEALLMQHERRSKKNDKHSHFRLRDK